jgi:hypothetical protein
MDEDEKEMLAEARVRLANTKVILFKYIYVFKI